MSKKTWMERAWEVMARGPDALSSMPPLTVVVDRCIDARVDLAPGEIRVVRVPVDDQVAVFRGEKVMASDGSESHDAAVRVLSYVVDGKEHVDRPDGTFDGWSSSKVANKLSEVKQSTWKKSSIYPTFLLINRSTEPTWWSVAILGKALLAESAQNTQSSQE